MEAANQARVDVAEAKKKGEIGAKTREGETLQNAAKIDAKTKIPGFGAGVIGERRRRLGKNMEEVVEEFYNNTSKPWHGWISSAAFKVYI